MSKICPNCQNEVPESATFCPYCNAALSKPKVVVEEKDEEEEDFSEHEPYKVICPKCDLTVLVKNHHCPKCGQYVKEYRNNSLNRSLHHYNVFELKMEQTVREWEFLSIPMMIIGVILSIVFFIMGFCVSHICFFGIILGFILFIIGFGFFKIALSDSSM